MRAEAAAAAVRMSLSFRSKVISETAPEEQRRESETWRRAEHIPKGNCSDLFPVNSKWNMDCPVSFITEPRSDYAFSHPLLRCL